MIHIATSLFSIWMALLLSLSFDWSIGPAIVAGTITGIALDLVWLFVLRAAARRLSHH